MEKNGIRHFINNNNSRESIVFIDDAGNEIECFWFASHEVMVCAYGCDHFEFSAKNNPEIFKYFTKIASRVKRADEFIDTKCVVDGKFTWHHLVNTLNWENNAGFVVSKKDDCFVVDFFPSSFESILDNAGFASFPLFMGKDSHDVRAKIFMISMGGANNGTRFDPMSINMAVSLNELINNVPISKDTDENERQ